jgi:cell division septation protein DedD
MADDDTTDPAVPTVAELAERQERTETRLDQVLEAVRGIAGTAHAGAQDATEARLDAPGSIAAQVQAELDLRDRRAKAEDTAATVGSLKETVAKLTEKTPEPPIRRVERFMGWGR